MSTFEREGFEWRETYFVLFDEAKRPKLKQIEKLLKKLTGNFEISGGDADDDGMFESISLLVPDDHAAIDISYLAGEEVTEQLNELVKELKPSCVEADEKKKLARIPQLNARLDLLLFEQVSDDGGEESDEPEEMLDPSSLLLVLEALVDFTGGVGVDPQSGTVM